MTKLEKAIEYVDKLWKQQPNEFGIMPDLGNEFMWVVDFMQEQEAELEALKKDVARYIKFIENDNYGENGLDSYFVKGEYLPHENKENGYLETRGRLIEEAETLYEKLSKVGK